MAAATCSMLSVRPSTVARPAARRPLTVCSAAPRPVQKVEEPKKAVQIAAAGMAALWLLAAPMAMADDAADKVKAAVCASNPTSRLCLKNSALKQ